METKICNKCAIEKSINEFELRSDTHRYRNTCKQCRKEYCSKWHRDNIKHVKEYNENNKEHIKERSRKYYQDNKERLIAYSKAFRNNNKEYYSEYNKMYKEIHKDEISDYNKKYNEENNERRLEYKKQYHKENKEYERDYANKHRKERLKTDKLFKLKIQLRHLVYHSLERKGYKKKSHTYEILGCDYETFITYLLETYRKNYGIEWDGKEKVHIDHIKPLATAKTEEDVIKLCNYKNLQLLKGEDNLAKSDKLDWELGDR